MIELIHPGEKTQTTYRALLARIDAMHPGVPLPPVPALMTELETSRSTLDTVFTTLEQQGLIERKRGKGVFVADRRATGEIAIVLSEAFLAPGASATYAQQCRLLRQELHEVNPKWSVKLHLGAGAIPGQDLPETLDLLEPMVLPRLRGVLSFVGLYEVGAKLQATGVPVVYFGGEMTNPGAHAVYLDYKQMLRDGIRHLAECGCRSVCLLHGRYVGKRPVEESQVPVAAAAAAECGVAFRDEWFGYEEGGWDERQGHDLFLRVWNNGQRPDGIFVSDDVLCRGVLRAIQKLGVELPRDLRLVTNANRGFGFPYPRAVSRVEFDLDEATDKAVRMMEKLAQGKPLETPVEWVRGTLVKGETT